MSRYSVLRISSVSLVVLFIAIAPILILRQVLDDGGVSRHSKDSVMYGIADPNLVTETPSVQASQLATMKSVGITGIRVDANWSWVQPDGPTTFQWGKLDQEINSIRNASMSVDLIIDGCPQWAAVPGTAGDQFAQPASSTQFAGWAAEVAKRYGPKGVHDFEIWNEPNIVQFWKPKPNPVAYAADLKAAYMAIKTVDSSAFVISGGLSPAATDGTNYSPISFLQAIYAHGARESFDALGYHSYSFPAVPDTYKSWSAWSQMAQTNPSIRSVMAKNGDFHKSIWITEFGAPSSGPTGVGAAAQRVDISQALSYVKKVNWIGALYIYTWQDTVARRKDDEFGLLTVSDSPKPAYLALVSALADAK
jgi:hypothetical protein